MPNVANTTNVDLFEAMFTTREALKILNVSRPTLAKLVKIGKLPAVKVGGTWRFKPSLLREYVETGMVISARGRKKR